MSKTNQNTPSAFATLFGKEILSDAITKKSPADMVIAILSISVCYGIDRVEAVIKNTYCKNEADQVLGMINTALQMMPTTPWKLAL